MTPRARATTKERTEKTENWSSGVEQLVEINIPLIGYASGVKH